MGIFKIKANGFQWISGAADNPLDLCLHGHVTVQFGDTVLEDHSTVSAKVLYQLRTLSEDILTTTVSVICRVPVLSFYYK